MKYKLSVSFVCDEESKAELLSLQAYTLIQQAGGVWNLCGQLLSETDDPKAPINVVLSHADMDVKTPALMYHRPIDPVQMPTEISITCSDPQGGFHQKMLCSGAGGNVVQYRGVNNRFQVEIELDKGVEI